jgi:hypothetical protein
LQHRLGFIGGAAPATVPRPKLLTTPEISVNSVVPTLPKTQYKEQHEKEFERSLRYVHIQCEILQALEKHDTALTTRDAYKWTSRIVPDGQWPQPLQALRLCYYMRSLGYETYANIKTSYDPDNGGQTTGLRLLIVNPNSEERGMGHDHLYWAQDVNTGEVVSKAYKLQRQIAQASNDVRRNAEVPDFGPPFNTEMIG